MIAESSAQFLSFIVATLCLTSQPFSHDPFKLENFSRGCQAHLSEFSVVHSLGHLSLECLDTAIVLSNGFFLIQFFPSYFLLMNSATS